MKGIELSEKYYTEFGKDMIHSQFSEYEKFIAVGLCGSGSECMGYDDSVSTDHDFEPGFCMFIPDESIIDNKIEFALERAYAKLPKEFMGYKRNVLSPVGGNRHGVIRISDFFEKTVGSSNGDLSLTAWLKIPSFYLLEATNGKVFRDDLGQFTLARENLSKMPEDVMKKRLAGNLLLTAQSGQYNFIRCISHGEFSSAQLALNKFVGSALETVFLLNGKYMPYYKWSFRALKELEFGRDLQEDFDKILYGDNREKEVVIIKEQAVKKISFNISERLKEKGYIDIACDDLEKCAYLVNDKIKDANIRNLEIFYCV